MGERMKNKLLLTVSNGLGSQSMYLLYLAGIGKVKADYSITADTGSEKTRTWNTGEVTTAEFYFNQVTKPLAERFGIDARFVRVVDKDKKPLPSIEDWLRRELERAKQGERKSKYGALHIPLFGDRGGRLRQTCTDRWKIQAMKQEARRLKATFVYTAIGIHAGEAWRRVKGVYSGEWKGFDSYHTLNGMGEVESWLMHCYPLVDLKLDRDAIRKEMERLDIPFLLSSECDLCPHQDKDRWLRLPPERIEEIADLEAQWQGEYFLTSQKKPLKEVIAKWRNELPVINDEASFGCEGGFCGI